MAIQTKTVAIAASDTGTFVFTTPAGTYSKTGSLEVTDGGEGTTVDFAADVVNGDGTTTGTLDLGGPVTGNVNVWIADT